MPNFINLAGQKINRLTIVSRDYSKKRTAWLCLCDCGNSTVISSDKIISGHTKSCGCLNSELSSARNTTHGLSSSPEYGVWNTMVQRCTNKNTPNYKNYGGRGITVCDSWIKSFSLFIFDMGLRPTQKHTIERINNNLGYSPNNCQWETMTTQANNRRNNRLLSFDNKTLTISQWSKITNIKYHTINMRLKRGWSVKKTLTFPVLVL